MLPKQPGAVAADCNLVLLGHAVLLVPPDW
jgi:hypothetical protein